MATQLLCASSHVALSWSSPNVAMDPSGKPEEDAITGEFVKTLLKQTLCV